MEFIGQPDLINALSTQTANNSGPDSNQINKDIERLERKHKEL